MARARYEEPPESVRLSDGTLAHVVRSAYAGGWELAVDGTPQSHVDLDDPTHLHFEYVARMGAVIDLLRMPRQPLTAVHLGAGAMTLPRYIDATRPGSRQQVIELEPALVELVRNELPLPRGASIRVRIGDAREGLGRLPAALAGNVDLLVSDVYAGSQTPAHLTTVEFYTAAERLLGSEGARQQAGGRGRSPGGGVLLVNVADGAGLAFARRQVATVRAVFPHVLVLAEVQVLKGRRFGNLVIAASRSDLPSEWLPRLMAAGPHPAKVAQGAELDEFVRGARVATDADATPSPKPAASVFER
ncbi:fused MFS/spermidine synthase [Microbacterium sp.]|uniref:spermidine synthase n=1 Tax=Microbacterium sp. TaxID=51671 RepID=UPI002E35BB9E|nr:fused MFS/spermidine synthase [Microbacterium sp.]HEX5731178.1 fused MFS/spermidine synthase [Microbacterium sp.]